MIGLKTYTRKPTGSYANGKYTCFWSDEMGQLQKYLCTFPGIILGFNVRRFDYQFLGQHFSLQGIMEKTVDVLELVQRIVGYRRGLSLSVLADMNLHKHKVMTGLPLAKLLRRGELKSAWQYNERDCDLTFALWWRIVRTRSVRIERDMYEWEPWMAKFDLSPPQPDPPFCQELSYGCATVALPETDWDYWCGARSLFTSAN